MTTQNDLLVPPYDSTDRKSKIVVATFNLIATIVGGGVLSLPYAFQKLGIGLATLFMILAAFVTDRTLFILCLSARMTGASSYGELGRVAFGPWMETALACLIFVFLLFVIVAYQVLLRDIWAPLVGLFIASPDGRNVDDNLVLLVIVILLIPFAVQDNLYALRYNCFLGFASVSILCFALCIHGFFGTIPTEYSHSEPDSPMLVFSLHFGDTLLSFPIIMLSFLSHFNVLPIQGALIEPSRQRMETVVHLAIAGCFCLMWLFGLGGYVFAGANTEGNILLNVSANNGDVMFTLGRIGMGITVMMATPMMVLPCRENFLELLDVMVGTEAEQDVGLIGEQTALLRSEPIQHDPVFQNPWIHYGATMGILFGPYMGAVAVPSVAIVWSLCGSSMAFLIAFILPTAYFLQIQRKEQTPNCSMWVIFSWIVLVSSILGAIICTIQTIHNIF